MEKLGENIKKLLLAGIGAAAVTAEKSKDILEDSKEILDELVEKGELTVEQGKVLNEELKHNIKKAVKENVNVSVKPSSAEELGDLLDKMTPEQLEMLKAQILKRESEKEAVKETEKAEEAGKEPEKETEKAEPEVTDEQ